MKGVGDGTTGAITAPHESTAFAYDVFGRVSSNTSDGVSTTNYVYDTLDRVAQSIRSGDGLITRKTYSTSGVNTMSCESGTNANAAGSIYTDNNRCQYSIVDALGRVTKVVDATNVPTLHTNYELNMTYDPYDRVLTSQNGSLASIASSAQDQTSYFAYNSYGKLTRQIGPVMRTVAGELTDDRRSWSEFVYDNLGRRVYERVRLSGKNDIVTANSVPNGVYLGTGNARGTQTQYDTWDRVYYTSDADYNYSYYAYDGLGNLISKSLAYCGGLGSDASCYDSIKKDDGTSPINSELVMYYTYDAAGRVTKTQDYRGNVSRVRYNAMGQVVAESDARGITTKAYFYTGDGLIDSIYEPDNDPATTNTTFIDSGITTGYVITKSFSYANTTRKYPTSTCMYGLNTNTAGAGAACTSYVYDWAGRPTTTTLPDTTNAVNSTITQTYDARGNVTSLKDADGFVTQYEFDAWNKLRTEIKLPRANNAIDLAAFPSGFTGLKNTYEYDRAGNLTKKTERGLITEYWYNSLGKAIGESRPHTSAVIPNAKYRAYRLDGELLAECSYDEVGTLFKTPSNFDDAAAIPTPPTIGNITGYKLTPGGKRYKEWSVGNGITEFTADIYFNGLGLKTKRVFSGNSGIYASVNTDAKSNLPPNYNTFWTYNANGNILTSYNALPDGTYSWDSFNYKYDKTDKEVSRIGNVFVYAPSKRIANYTRLVGQTSSSGLAVSASVASAPVYNDPPGSPPIARPLSVTTFDYNEIGLYQNINVTDTDLRGNTANRSTKYEYYLDGQKSKTTTTQQIPDPNQPLARPPVMITQTLGTQTFTYDSRGRLITNVDSNGSSGAPLTTTTSYSTDGVTTNSLSDGSYNSTQTSTVGGLGAKFVKHAVVGRDGCLTAPCDNTTTMAYDSDGRIASNITNPTGSASSGDPINFYYDNYGNLISQTTRVSNLGITQIYSATFDTANAMTSKTGYNIGTVTFALSSKGWRLSTPTTNGNYVTPFENMDSQRYDAEGRSTHLERVNYSAHAYFPNIYPQNWATTAFDVRYDPKGNEVLTALSFLREEQDTDHDGLVNPNLLNIRTNSTVFVDGNVLFMHALHSTRGYQITSDGFNFWHSYTDVNQIRDQDETFSLADGTLNQPDTFDVTKAIWTYGANPTNSSTTLQAPITPTSTTIGVVSASAVTPPTSSATPPPATGVTPPSSNPAPASTSTPSSSIAITNAAETPTVSNPDFGISSVNVTPATSQTPSTSQTPATTSTTSSNDFSSSTALQPPSSVTPPALSSVSSASSVTSPNSSTPSLPGDASSVTPPGSSVPPSSSTPSSSGVTPPAGSSPGTATGVTPPSSGGTVTALDYWSADGKTCKKSPIGTKEGSGCDPRDLNEQADRLQKEIDQAVNDQIKAEKEAERAKVLAHLTDLKYYARDKVSAYAAVVSILDSPTYKNEPLDKKLKMWDGINYKLATGRWNAKDLWGRANQYKRKDEARAKQQKTSDNPPFTVGNALGGANNQNTTPSSFGITLQLPPFGYLDTGVMLCYIACYTFGLFWGNDGKVYPYIGFGAGIPQADVYANYSSSSPSPGLWSIQFSAGISLISNIAGPDVGWGSDSTGSKFFEYGGSAGAGPLVTVSITGYYTAPGVSVIDFLKLFLPVLPFPSIRP